MSSSLPPFGGPSGPSRDAIASPSRDAIAMMQYDAAKKSALLAYLLWFFLGYFGAHRFYLGRIGSGVMMLLIFLVSFPLAYVLIGLLGFLVIFLWWLIDALLIPGIVARHNTALISQLQR
jgi:TM2 domain-containing membrane protein YozV